MSISCSCLFVEAYNAMIGDFFLSFWTHHRSSWYLIIYAFSLIERLYLFVKPAVRWRPPYLNLIAYPAIYPFWLIPVQLETSRHHIFSCLSRAISAISKPKSVEENGCRACDVHNPRRHLHEVRGRSWLCMVEEVGVPPHRTLPLVPRLITFD